MSDLQQLVQRLDRAEAMIRQLQGGVAGIGNAVMDYDSANTYGGAGTVLSEVTMDTSGGNVLLLFSCRHLHSGVDGVLYTLSVSVEVDGTVVDTIYSVSESDNPQYKPGSGVYLVENLAAGSHTFTIYISAVTATPAIGTTLRRLIAIELPAL